MDNFKFINLNFLMVKLGTLVGLLISAGYVSAVRKCRIVHQGTEPYAVTSSGVAPYSASSSSPGPSPTSLAPSLDKDSCLKIANFLQFTKGGFLNSAGDGNPFANALRKESAGFSLPFTAVPGKPIKTYSAMAPGLAVNTENYEINFIYNQLGSEVLDVKCHYKGKDIGGDDKSSSAAPTAIATPTAATTTSKLQFLKGSFLNSNFRTISVDIGAAGEAKQIGNKYAADLRKISGGFEFIMSQIPGNPFLSANNGPVSYTDDYEVNIEYNSVDKKIMDVKCHYKSKSV
ncbi:hypothetical protein CONCODRAFT_6441 [Conidiobolus coronatus NRRL 28638]|uniref:Uncharacterized protein n=1 Tax=Conidiobolus coronatus (strain ATCC 28846 / CBS 209.66 / NRRL 28638) TaxID=796925 RepID=A0A137P7B2_CONC2|nr:hypothetical protein CONCODRAFT_6441 [Conidiobolus coronatus NRRL 28638]|eukprot:KXN70907.1 hypothetical protein CONCODRAFT_6441 [Conidiobolus coronatus NRRL 28638]